VGAMTSLQTIRAREMRSSMSSHEVRLWARLRRLRERGYHFRRQVPFRGYYLDFVCFSRKLVVEVDGSQHAEVEQIAHDRRRDAVLAREGFQTLRITTGRMNHEFDAVMETILAALEGRLAPA
jgi:very-short-patch-repair endonuclease